MTTEPAPDDVGVVRDERNLAGAIYGTILATSVVAGLSEGGDVGKGPAALVVLSTSAVFYVAHVYAGLLGHHLHPGRGFSWTSLRVIARHEWPILTSGLPPAIVLALGRAGLFDEDTAYNLAIGVGILFLVLWGVAYAREQGYHLVGVVATGVVNGLLGVAIVALKVAVH